MTLKVQHKRSAVKDKVPLVADLTYGEIGINYHTDDPAVFTLDSTDHVVRLNDTKAAIGTTPPSNKPTGRLWLNTNNGVLYMLHALCYIYYIYVCIIHFLQHGITFYK